MSTNNNPNPPSPNEEGNDAKPDKVTVSESEEEPTSPSVDPTTKPARIAKTNSTTGFFGSIYSGVTAIASNLWGAENLEVDDPTTGAKVKAPAEAPEGERKSLSQQLSRYLGKDIISMLSLPVSFFEPLTFLQRVAEALQFFDLLDKGCTIDDPIDRIAFVATFHIATFSIADRITKPFNPLLGETFEYIPSHGKFKYFAEQVSHHPPIGVGKVFTDNFEYTQEFAVKTKFMGNSLDCSVTGREHLFVHKYNEHFSFGHPATCCHNIVVGSMYLDHTGEFDVTNHTTGDKCIIKFLAAGWLSSANRHEVQADIIDATGKKRMSLTGKWNEFINATKYDDKGQKIKEYQLWKLNQDLKKPVAGFLGTKYKLSKFVVDDLLKLDAEYESVLLPSDARLRSDRRLLEMGDNKKSGEEKHRLEEKQRAEKREREKNGSVYTPKYFKKIDDVTGSRWEYSGNYWEERTERITNVNKLSTSTATTTVTSTAPISTSDSANDLIALNDNDNDDNSDS